MSSSVNPFPLLLVCDKSETCERMASALLSVVAFYRIERVTSAEWAQNGAGPLMQVAIVDQDLKATRQAEVVQQLSHAGLATVALVDSRDIQALQEVVRAGATALVATPFGDAELWQAVDSALANGSRHLAQDMSGADRALGTGKAIVVAVHSPKGGTGVLVIAANLAVALQEHTVCRVASLELAEGPGNIRILLTSRGTPPGRPAGPFRCPGDVELMDGVMARHASGLRCLRLPRPACGWARMSSRTSPPVWVRCTIWWSSTCILRVVPCAGDRR